MTEFLLVLVGVLLAVTASAAVEYYRQLCRVQKEYDKAKGIVEDIVLSVNRQFKLEAQNLEIVAYKVEAISSKSDKAWEKAKEFSGELYSLKPEIASVSADQDKTMRKVDEIDKKVCDVIASQETFLAKISDIEKQTQRHVATSPVQKIGSVIPIKREKALAPLTETELSVLEILALEGSQTASEIRDRIGLSREHTARLMKKLYEEGYLERDTSKIPFKYWIKKEMKKLLKNL